MSIRNKKMQAHRENRYDNLNGSILLCLHLVEYVEVSQDLLRDQQFIISRLPTLETSDVPACFYLYENPFHAPLCREGCRSGPCPRLLALQNTVIAGKARSYPTKLFQALPPQGLLPFKAGRFFRLLPLQGKVGSFFRPLPLQGGGWEGDGFQTPSNQSTPSPP